ncbi:Eaa protein [Salmonella enterica]|nr:Eaa protein [Salmonella enterica]
MTTITREEVKAFIEQIESDLSNGWEAQIFELKLARIAQASLEAEPVRYLNKFSGTCVTLEQQSNAADDVAVYVPLFAAPPVRDNKQTDELVMWVKRLAHSLRNARPNSKLHDAAMDYLSRKGLISVEDVLR